MNRFSLILACCVIALADRGAVAKGKLNVLFIAVDDLRVELGCYGSTPVKTPNIDRLAKRGLLFNRAYCQQALCNPSRSSLMTGRRPDTLKIWDLPTHFRETIPDVVTLPEHFKRNGYFTQNIGKVFHNWRQKIHGDPHSWSVPAVMHYATHDSDTPRVAAKKLPPDLAPLRRTESRDVPDDAYFDGRIANLAVKTLRKIKDEPFFLAVGFWKPHLPFNAPKKYWDLYDRAKIALPANPRSPKDVPQIALHNGREVMRSVKGKLTDDNVRELRHGYFAAISYLDAQVGKVLEELDRLKLRDSTVVVFWSDHGFHLGEHGLWCKTSNFELDARVPLIVAPPKYQRGGAKTESLVELLDLYPTLVDLCGLPPATGTEGKSLGPILDDPNHAVKTAAFTQHPRPAYYKGQPTVMGYSLRSSRYRYTEWREWKTHRVSAVELYDHRKDPGENHNIAGRPENAKLMRGFSKRIIGSFSSLRRKTRVGQKP